MEVLLAKLKKLLNDKIDSGEETVITKHDVECMHIEFSLERVLLICDNIADKVSDETLIELLALGQTG